MANDNLLKQEVVILNKLHPPLNHNINIYCIAGKFGEVLIWQFGGLEKIAKLN